jgi:hypothetical protein
VGLSVSRSFLDRAVLRHAFGNAARAKNIRQAPRGTNAPRNGHIRAIIKGFCGLFRGSIFAYSRALLIQVRIFPLGVPHRLGLEA